MRSNKHKYIVNPNYLFEDDNVDEVANVSSHRPRCGPRSRYGKTSEKTDTEVKQESLLERKHKLLQQTLDTSMRSIGLLNETEVIGVGAATELHHQHEKLENTNRKFDEINTNLNESKKSLTNIKSSFYACMHFIFGRPLQNPQRAICYEPNNVKEEKSKQKYSFKQKSNKNIKTKKDSLVPHTFSEKGNKKTNLNSNSNTTNHYNEEIEINLNEMAEAVSRLKTLGTNLSEEIESQIRLLDIIEEKVEANDIKIDIQNKDINKILEK